MIAATQPATPFTSLAKLQEEHSLVVKDVGTNILHRLKPISEFIHRCLATGKVLDDPAERDAAQSLITFWVGRIQSAQRSKKEKALTEVPDFEDTLLEEFDPEVLTKTVIEPAEAWLKAHPQDESLARRIILRLVYLREDGGFDVLPGVRDVCEGLAQEQTDQERADPILKELTKLGVVRTVRCAPGQADVALRSAVLLERWPRLRGWLDERRQFRERATAWAKKRASKAATAEILSFGRRLEQRLGSAVIHSGEWIEDRWYRLLGAFGFKTEAAELLKTSEYEEAETYRDKNGDELKLVYQKRLQDRDREERRHVRAFVFAVTSIVFAVLSGIAYWGWVKEGQARENADKATAAAKAAREKAEKAEEREKAAKKDAVLENALWQITRGGQLHGSDTPGALLWYAAAWAKLLEDVGSPQEGRPARVTEVIASHPLRLGDAQRRLPTLTAMAYQENGPKGTPPSVATVSADGIVALTAGIDDTKTELVVTFWRQTDQSGWEPKELRGKLPADLASLNRRLGVYLSPNGRVAAVTLGLTPKENPETSKEKQSVFLYGLTIPEKAERLPNPLTVEGGLTDTSTRFARFSPDGLYFGLVTSTTVDDKMAQSVQTQSTVSVWDVAGWQPHPLANPTQTGTIGALAFAPGEQGRAAGYGFWRALRSFAPDKRGRVAAVFRSDSNEMTCLEWTLGDKQPEAGAANQPKRYKVPPVQRGVGEEVVVATYGPPGQNLLFVSRGHEQDELRNAWLFDTRGTTAEVLDGWRYLGPITAAAFSPGGDRLVTASWDGSIVLWNLTQRQPGGRRPPPYSFPEKHSGRVFQVAFSPDGQYALTTSRDQRAIVWDLGTGARATPLHHSGSVTEGAFTADGTCVVTASSNAAYRWQLPQNRTESRSLLMDLPRAGVDQIATTDSLDRVGRVLAVGGWVRSGATGEPKGWARAWDTATGLPITPELPHERSVNHVAVAPDGSLICTTDVGGTVCLWNRAGQQVWTEPECAERAMFTALGAAGGQHKLVVVSRLNPDVMAGRSTVRVYTFEQADGPTRMVVGERQTAYFDQPLTAAVFSPGCEWVAAYAGDAGDGRGQVVVWKPDGEHRQLGGAAGQPAHQEPITHAAFSRDGRRLVATSRDDRATVWILSGADWERHELRPEGGGEIAGHTADINFAAFDDTGDRVVTASADGSAVVWALAPGEKRYRPTTRLRPESVTGGVTQAMFLDDQLVLTAGNDRAVRVWGVSGGQLVALRTNLSTGAGLRYGTDRGPKRIAVFGRADGGPVFGVPPDRQYSQARLPQFVVTEWQLDSSAPPSRADLLAVAELAAARRISLDDPTHTAPLPLEEAAKLWQQIKLRQAASQATPGDLVSWYVVEATRCERSGNWYGARWYWDQLVKTDRPELRYLFLARSARARVALNDLAGAEKDFQAALEQRAGDPDLLVARAELRVRQAGATTDKDLKAKILAEAIEDYQAVLKANPEDRVSGLALANLYLDTGNTAAAVEQFDKLTELVQQDPNLLRQRARILRDLMKFRRAREDHLAAAKLLDARRNRPEAIKDYQTALELLKQDAGVPGETQARIHADLGELQLKHAETLYGAQREGFYRDAQKHFQEAVGLDAKGWEYRRGLGRVAEGRARASVGSDRAAERAQHWKEAREQYDKALELKPDDLGLVAFRAGALIQLNDWAAATKDYETLAAGVPTNLTYHTRLAELHLQPVAPGKPVSPGQLEAARACLERATKVPELSNRAILWLRLAVVQLRANKLEEYRATRKRMLEQFKDSMTLEDANNVAWAVALGPGQPEGIDRALALAERAVTSTSSFPNANYLNTYGAVLCRAGRSAEAVKQLQLATKTRYRSPGHLTAYGDTLDLLFIALAHTAAKQPDQAKQALADAEKLVKDTESTPPPDNPEQRLTLVWARVEYEFLASEVKNSLIKP